MKPPVFELSAHVGGNMKYLTTNSLPLHHCILSGHGSMCHIDFRSCPDTGCRCPKILAKICPDTSQPKSSLFVQKVQKVSGLGSSLGRDNPGSSWHASSYRFQVSSFLFSLTISSKTRVHVLNYYKQNRPYCSFLVHLPHSPSSSNGSRE